MKAYFFDQFHKPLFIASAILPVRETLWGAVFVANNSRSVSYGKVVSLWIEETYSRVPLRLDNTEGRSYLFLSSNTQCRHWPQNNTLMITQTGTWVSRYQNTIDFIWYCLLSFCYVLSYVGKCTVGLDGVIPNPSNWSRAPPGQVDFQGTFYSVGGIPVWNYHLYCYNIYTRKHNSQCDRIKFTIIILLQI